MARIHPTAVVDPVAEIADSVEIGPYCVIEGPVRLAEGVRLLGQAHLLGPLEIGEGTIVWPFAALGREPQDYKFRPGTPTAGVVIGRDCLIREHVTVHAATREDRPTRIGDGVFMMQNAHVGHDGQIGDRVILVNSSLIAGHGEVHERANISGNSAIHQYVRIGRLAMLSGNVGISRDLPPYCICRARNRMAGINVIGMRRAGHTAEEVRATRTAYRDLLRPNLPQSEVIAELERRGESCAPLLNIARFIRESKRGICASEHAPPPGFTAWMRAHESNELATMEDAD